jgi:hypothetical protein
MNSQKWMQIANKFYVSEHSLVLCLPFTTSCKQCGFKNKYFNAKLRVVLTVSWLAIQYVSILSLIVSFVITWLSWSSVFINIDNRSWCTETFPSSSISCKQHKSYVGKDCNKTQLFYGNYLLPSKSILTGADQYVTLHTQTRWRIVKGAAKLCTC